MTTSRFPQEAIDILCDADAAASPVRAIELMRRLLHVTPDGVLTQRDGEPIEVQP